MLKKSDRPLTIRERMVVRNILSGMSLKDALISAGYAESTATKKAGETVGKSRIQAHLAELMEKAGITDEYLVQKLKEGLEATKLIPKKER